MEDEAGVAAQPVAASDTLDYDSDSPSVPTNNDTRGQSQSTSKYSSQASGCVESGECDDMEDGEVRDDDDDNDNDNAAPANGAADNDKVAVAAAPKTTTARSRSRSNSAEPGEMKLPGQWTRHSPVSAPGRDFNGQPVPYDFEQQHYEQSMYGGPGGGVFPGAMSNPMMQPRMRPPVSNAPPPGPYGTGGQRSLLHIRAPTPRDICRFFIRGRCMWADECNFVHMVPADPNVMAMISPSVAYVRPPFMQQQQVAVPPQPLCPELVSPTNTPRISADSAWEQGLIEAKKLMRQAKGDTTDSTRKRKASPLKDLAPLKTDAISDDDIDQPRDEGADKKDRTRSRRRRPSRSRSPVRSSRSSSRSSTSNKKRHTSKRSSDDRHAARLHAERRRHSGHANDDLPADADTRLPPKPDVPNQGHPPPKIYRGTSKGWRERMLDRDGDARRPARHRVDRSPRRSRDEHREGRRNSERDRRRKESRSRSRERAVVPRRPSERPSTSERRARRQRCSRDRQSPPPAKGLDEFGRIPKSEADAEWKDPWQRGKTKTKKSRSASTSSSSSSGSSASSSAASKSSAKSQHSAAAVAAAAAATNGVRQAAAAHAEDHTAFPPPEPSIDADQAVRPTSAASAHSDSNSSSSSSSSDAGSATVAAPLEDGGGDMVRGASSDGSAKGKTKRGKAAVKATVSNDPADEKLREKETKRKELLKQLQAVEDAINRKKSRSVEQPEASAGKKNAQKVGTNGAASARA